MFTTKKFILRSMLQESPGTLFVFGDNMAQRGYGGQAREMRDEPNAVGLVTKWRPSNGSFDFFCDDDFDRAKSMLDPAFRRLADHLRRGGNVVWPEAGVGTGLAELSTRAPRIAAYIEKCRAALAAI